MTCTVYRLLSDDISHITLELKTHLYSLCRHRWIHCMTDHSPLVEPPEDRKFLQDHVSSKTGTDEEYVPYSTTLPKIHSWQPNH